MHQILTKRVIQSETTLHLVYPEGHQNKIKQVTSQYRNTKLMTPYMLDQTQWITTKALPEAYIEELAGGNTFGKPKRQQEIRYK